MTAPEMAGYIVAGIVMFIGLIGSVLPGLPGAPLIFLAALGHKLYFKEHSVSYLCLGIILFLALLSLVLDFLASTLGAKKMGASWRGILGAMVGAVIGLFFSLPGIILGPILGAFLFEMAGGREWRESARAGAGAMIGFFIGALGKAVCCVVMIGIFYVSAFWNSRSIPLNAPGTIIARASVQDRDVAVSRDLKLRAETKPWPFESVSSHSATGSESATIPAPTLK
jgi:uncharacterized protein YqgC (DUF456 family)